MRAELLVRPLIDVNLKIAGLKRVDYHNPKGEREVIKLNICDRQQHPFHHEDKEGGDEVVSLPFKLDRT